MLLAVYSLINELPETHHWVQASKMTGNSIFPDTVCLALFFEVYILVFDQNEENIGCYTLRWTEGVTKS